MQSVIIQKKITIRDLAKAVASCEGYGVPDSLATLYRNPGNVRKRCDKGVGKHGFGICSTEEKGYQLLEKTINWYKDHGATLKRMIRYYSPPSDGNDTVSHTQCIADKAQIDKNIPLKDLL